MMRTPAIRHGLVLLLLALALAACTARQESKLRLGVVIPTATHSFTSGIVWWTERAKAELEAQHPDLEVVIKTAANTGEQANQIQDLVTVNRVGAIVALPLESAALTRPLAEAKRAGVYVTVVDRGLSDPNAQDAYVGGDNEAFGRLAAEYLADRLQGEGNVVALRGIPTTIDNERMQAFQAVLDRHPGIRLLDARHGNWNRDDAFKVMQDYLARFNRIDAVWAADDDMAVGVLKAIGQAGRDDIRIVFGGAGAKDAVRTILEGTDPRIQADVSYSPGFIRDAIRLTAEARLKGEVLPARTILPSVLITRDNAADFYHPDSPF